MIVHFNQISGDIIEIINNEHFVQGDMNTHDIDVIFDNSFDNTNYNAYIQFLRQGESIPSPKLVMTPKIITYNNETYRGYSFKVQTNWYTAIAGTLKATIEVKEYTDDGLQSNKAYGIVNIPIEDAVDDNPQVDSTITDEEYLALMNLVNSKLNSESDTSNNQTLENPTINGGTINGGNISNSNLQNVVINEVTIGEQNSVEKAPTSPNNITNKAYVDSYTETRVNEKIDTLLDSGFNGLVLNNLNMNNPTVEYGKFTHPQLSYVLINGGNVTNCWLKNCYVNDEDIILDTNVVNKKYVDSVGARVSAIEESYVTGIKTPTAYISFTSGGIDLTSEFNRYLSTDGGTIFGNLDVKGAVSVLGALNVENLFVSGTMTAINSEELVVKDKVIIVGDGNQSALTSPAGFVVPKYDGVNFGGLFFDNNGNAYVGDVNLDSNGNIVNISAMPLATRKFSSENSSLNGKIAILGYDDETKAVYITESDKTPNDLISDVLEQDRITKEYVDSRIAESIYNALLEDY